MLIDSVKTAKRWIIIIFGFTVLAIGLALLVTPGPGIPIVILGLFILSAEYVWAKKLMQRVKDGYNKIIKKEEKKP